LADWYVT